MAPAPDASERPSGLLRRTIVSVVVIAVLLAAGAAGFRRFAAFFSPPPKVPGGAPLPVVRAIPVARGPYEEALRGYGTARVLREARVAAEVAGVVREVSPSLRVGARVEAPAQRHNGGPPVVQPLVVLDARDLGDTLARLEAQQRQIEADLARNRTDVASLDRQLEVANRRLETSRAELERIRSLVEQETLAESELDRQRLAVFALEQMESELRARRDQTVAGRAVLEAQLEANRVEARQAGRDLERTRVYAPFDGRVLARHVDVGSRVAPGGALFDLVDLARVEVGVALPAGEWGRVEAGHQVALRLTPAGPVVWEGPVARVDPAIDTEARTFRVWVEVPGDVVAPGAPVIARVEGTLHEDVIPVPREAFLGDVLYVAEPADEEGVAVARRRRPDVETLLPGVALVRPSTGPGALAEGDLVVISNLEDIADGSRIKIVPIEADEPAR